LAEGGISPEVRRFIQNAINSVEQLEVLLFLVSNAERSWSAREVSERVRLAPDTVEARLVELRAAQLLVSTTDSEVRYHYAPQSSALAQEVAESLNKAYKERREALIQIIYSRPLANIKFFADAFRLRKDQEEED
jgi:hypothetical protein